MAENSKIEWTDHTFNPWEGCQKVGPGCDHCYAETRNARFGAGRAINWGPGAPRRRTSAANWRQPLQWNAAAERLGVRYRVFCASLADVFDNQVPAAWLADLLTLINATPNLDWLLLTKRIGNFWDRMHAAGVVLNQRNEVGGGSAGDMAEGWLQQQPPENVWLGTTICNQAESDRDIPKLLAMPAAKRFLSMEPLLGPVDIVPFIGGRAIQCGCGFRRDEVGLVGATLATEGCAYCNKKTVTWPSVDWVIVGGESGPGARPMHPAWAGSLRDQCQAAGVPFFFKQWGDWAPELSGRPGWDPTSGREHLFQDGPEDAHTLMTLVGKKAAGRLLDGRTWDEVPL